MYKIQDMKYVPRMAESWVKQSVRYNPSTLLLGPRQSGKSTLVRTKFPDWEFADLERPEDYRRISPDIETFLKGRRHLILDEAQRLPDLFPALRHEIDRDRRAGRFILLGSASPVLTRNVSESLAGRVGRVLMTPFLCRELEGRAPLAERWFWGGFPPVLSLRPHSQRLRWISDMLATFFERDLPLMGLRTPPERMMRLFAMLSHVHGNLLNVSDLCRSLGIQGAAVNASLDILEGGFLIRRLQPYHANIQKRLTKSPKIYIRDTGLLHAQADLRHPRDLDNWSRRGASFEGLVVEELASWATQAFPNPGIYFWRTQAGAEVDLLLKNGPSILPIEIKTSLSSAQYSLKGIRECMKDLGLRRGLVILLEGESRDLGGGLRSIRFEDWIHGREEIKV